LQNSVSNRNPVKPYSCHAFRMTISGGFRPMIKKITCQHGQQV
jgi:hypothetical protein